MVVVVVDVVVLDSSSSAFTRVSVVANRRPIGDKMKNNFATFILSV